MKETAASSGGAPVSRVALATCLHFPDGDADDAGLPEAIGGDVRFAIWDDPTVDWSSFDAVVVRSTWDYQERRDQFLTWARGIGDRLINPPEILAWNTDKRYLRELAEAGLPVVPTELVAPEERFAAPAAGEYVVKPTVSAGSRDTARFGAPGHDRDADAARAASLVEAIQASGRTAMVQPYVASVDARGETALLFFDGAFSHAIHKGPLLERGADPTSEVFAAETILPREPSAAERAVAEQVLAHVADRFGGGAAPAYARVDVVEDDDGAPLVLELELTEPSLFFAGEPGRLLQFAAAIRRRMAGA
jgi:glutathione synthase/RimK-type ligase-like ATP-grasp enzyme